VKRPLRVPSQLSESLQQRLNAYALTATATAVGALGLTQAAEARIKYTPAHEYIEPGATIPLDVTHNGLPEFVFKNFRVGSSSSTGDFLWVSPASDFNRLVGVQHGQNYASALAAGVEVGPGGPFPSNSYANVMVDSGVGNGCLGQWCEPVNTRSRYLGLKFRIKGESHYGWARLRVHHRLTKHNGHKVWAILTGYAYETIPNKPIITGKTHGKDDATLGRLAQGASGVSNERKP
jgi:hypothetical protein